MGLASNLGVAAAVLTVTNAADSGPGSLRQAILDVNSTPGRNSVRFAIPGAGVQTITPLTALPGIFGQVSIDGYTQPGSHPNTLTNGNNAMLLVRLDGTNLPFATPVLVLNGAGNTVRGLIIVRAYTAIQLYNCSSSVIAGNWLGLGVDNIARGGTGYGVDVTCGLGRSTANLIGGTSPADRNVIAAFWTGIRFFPYSADHNTVQGNFIGTDPTGTWPMGNGWSGIIQGSGSSVIGGLGEANFTATLPTAAPTHMVVTATATDPDGDTSQFSSPISPNLRPADGPVDHRRRRGHSDYFLAERRRRGRAATPSHTLSFARLVADRQHRDQRQRYRAEPHADQSALSRQPVLPAQQLATTRPSGASLRRVLRKSGRSPRQPWAPDRPCHILWN